MDMKSWDRWDFESSTPLVDKYKEFYKGCDTLLEIGSLHGRNANLITEKLDVSNTYIVEANIHSYNLIKDRYPQYNIFNYAIGNENKTVQFNSVITDNPGVSSVLDRPDGYYKGKVDITNVEMYRGDTFLDNNNINHVDILKVDVEGFTYEVLEGFGDRLKDVKFIEAECENIVIWENQKTFKEINIFLESNGFKCLTPNINRTQFNAYWIRKK